MYKAYSFLIGYDHLDSLLLETASEAEKAAFLHKHKDTFVFTVLSYDLKNKFEVSLHSKNPNYVQADGSYWIVFKNVIAADSNKVQLKSDELAADDFLKSLLQTPVVSPEWNSGTWVDFKFKHRTEKATYLADVKAIQEAIRCGSVYELNYCQEFYAENVQLDMRQLYNKMKAVNPAPFSVCLQWEGKCMLGASPERFLAKRGSKLIAQPIKGTRRRLADEVADKLQREALQHDIKERAENVMIVDLMRNDLARCCQTGTVKVEELFGIYSFATVHQMISTVVGTLREGIRLDEILQNTFPMGSMTGTPKVESMKLIEQFEKVRRAWFSGSIGYIAPNGDFDLNVVIRTLIYNSKTGYLSLQTGGAITIDSVPEQEYEESLLKAEAWVKLLS